MTLSIRFGDKPLGHIVEGLDLRDLDDATFHALDRAYAEYGVLVIRGQTLSPEEQIAFSRRFGRLICYPLEEYRQAQYPEIFVVSNIIEDGKPIGMKEAGADWHTDMASTQAPPRGSILHALEVPHGEDGKALGDTLFGSGHAAYDALPAERKEQFEGKRAVFGLPAARAPSDEAAGDDTDKALKHLRQSAVFQPTTHPIVRRHPITGRKTLYVSPNGMHEILDVSPEESQELLAFLKAHVIQPDFVYRHSWRVGDIVMWDNCNAIHKAIQDYALPLRRKMYRTTIEGWPTQ